MLETRDYTVLPGDIVAIRGTSLISRLIVDFTGPISHVGMVLATPTSAWDQIQVIQALSTVKCLTLAETVANASYAYLIQHSEMPMLAREAMCEHAKSRIGTKYAYSNLVLQALDSTFRTNWWTSHFDQPDEVICSEFVAEEYRQVGVPLNISYRDITPVDIFDMALREPAWSIYRLK